MKIIFIVLFSIFTIQVHADTVDSVFQKNSPVPMELRVIILTALENNNCSDIQENSLIEISTEIYEDQYDQGKVDTYYTTKFQAYSSVGNMINFTVKSTEWDFNNPNFDKYEILSINSENDGVVKACQ